MKHPSIHTILSITLLLMMSGTSYASYVIPENGNAAPVYYNMPRCRQFGPHRLPDYNEFPVEGELVYLTSTHFVSGMEGKVIMFEPSLVAGSQLSQAINRYWNNSDIAAMVVQLTTSRSAGYTSWGGLVGEKTYQPFPVFEINPATYDALRHWLFNQTNSTVLLSIHEDYNAWEPVFVGSFPVLAYITLISNGALLLFGAFKLTFLITINGLQANVSQISLFFSLMGCLIRAVWCSYDPFGIYNIAPFAWVQIGWSISFPFTIGATFWIALYWHSLLQNTAMMNLSRNFEKLKIPFAIAFIVMFGVELATAVTRGIVLKAQAAILALDGALYAVYILIVCIFFTVTQIRLANLFKQINNGLHTETGSRVSADGRKMHKLQLSNRILYGITPTLVIILIDMIGFATDPIVHPWGFATIWWILFICIDIHTLCQMLLIRIPSHKWKFNVCGRQYVPLGIKNMKFKPALFHSQFANKQKLKCNWSNNLLKTIFNSIEKKLNHKRCHISAE